MSDSQAGEWKGRTIRLERELAVFREDTCRAPAYDRRDVEVRSLATSYLATPEQLGLPADSGAVVRTVRIRCGEVPWTSPAGLLVTPNREQGFIVWDGVFFEVRRAAE